MILLVNTYCIYTKGRRLARDSDPSQRLSKTVRDHVLLVVYQNILCATRVPKTVGNGFVLTARIFKGDSFR